jgi:DNA repair exonuclease SbcCD ATPase subunit
MDIHSNPISFLNERHKFVSRKLIEKDILEQQISNLKQEKEKQTKRHLAAIKARKLINIAAQNTQTNLKEYITKIVNLALQSVLPDPPVFSIDFVERRNKTECDLMLDGDRDTSENYAGGERDIVSFALRCIVLSLKQNRRTLFLDETFKNLSVDYHQAAAVMIKELSEKLKIQIIMVSHIPGLIQSADKIFKLKRKGA